MKLIATTINGIEDIAVQEVKGLLKTGAKKILPQRILIDKDSNKIFKARSINCVYKLLKRFRFENLNDILKKINKINFSFIKKDFRVRCNRTGNHKFGSLEIEKRVGGTIFKKGFKVNLKSKEIIYVDIINKNCLVGILLKDNLCKRDYRVRINNQGLNACLASALLKIVGWKKNEGLLDPFCKDGAVLIEAALLGGKKIYGMDSEFNLRSSKINAKMARAKITFYGEEIDWLDTRFKKNEIDKIITSIPFPSKRRNEKDVEKIYKEFLDQAKYVLKTKMLVISPKMELFEKCAIDFKIVEKREVNIKDLHYKILVLKK